MIKKCIVMMLIILMTGTAYAIDNPGTVPLNETFTILENETLVIEEGTTFDCYGTLHNQGHMIIDGTFIIHEWMPMEPMPDFGSGLIESTLLNDGTIVLNGELYNHNILMNDRGVIEVFGAIHNEALMSTWSLIECMGTIWNNGNMRLYGPIDVYGGAIIQGQPISEEGGIITYYGDIVTPVEDNVTGEEEVDLVENVTPPAVITPVVEEVKDETPIKEVPIVEKKKDSPAPVKKDSTVKEKAVKNTEVKKDAPAPVKEKVIKDTPVKKVAQIQPTEPVMVENTTTGKDNVVWGNATVTEPRKNPGMKLWLFIQQLFLGKVA